MVKVRVEFLASHTDRIHTLSRVPGIGESVRDRARDQTWKVQDVIQEMDSDTWSTVVATIRVDEV